MSPKKKYDYVCQECGYHAYQWLGKCPDCGQWNTFAEMAQVKSGTQKRREAVGGARTVDTSRVERLTDIETGSHECFSTGYEEFDRVLGGGMYCGATVLLAGEPGIGKSTLLLKSGVALAEHIAAATEKEQSVFYVAAEESAAQIKQRADRLSVAADNVLIVSETALGAVTDLLDHYKPTVVIIDSIQAMVNEDVDAAAGTISQVRDCASYLCHYARSHGCALILVGHVTKDGVLAGPKSLEHLVDTVIYFEGDRYDDIRLLRAVKNRHGATGELGVFEMRADGLAAVTNPSQFFLADDSDQLPGRATVALIEGRRPFLVEVQSLVNESYYNNPLRRTVGVEVNKISLLIAVLEKALRISLSKYDLFVKSAGGIVIKDPAADLAIAVAILTSYRQESVGLNAVFIGEVGLGGEIRRSKQVQARVTEAERLGFTHAYVPKGTKVSVKSITLVEVGTVKELYAVLFDDVAIVKK